MNIIVTGATGTAGAEVVRQATTDSDIQTVTALVRKPLAFQHPKLKTVLHHDFLDYSALESVFKDNQVCVWCLGISQTQVSEAEYHKITFDYVMAAASAMLKANPDMTFVFLSGMGADSSEQSRTLFARVKGQTENALKKLPFKKFFIARPGGIEPIHKKENTPFMERAMTPLFPLLQRIAPSYFITSVDLAKALLHIAKHGADKTILGNKDLKNLLPAL
jgi:uncharacterized protein YbjT (DUF2867 family)